MTSKTSIMDTKAELTELIKRKIEVAVSENNKNICRIFCLFCFFVGIIGKFRKANLFI